MSSPALALASMPAAERVRALAELTDRQKASLRWNWRFWARGEQLEPEGDWLVWLLLAGRGFGKTRTLAETIRSWVCGQTPLSPGRYSRIALVAETAADARDVIVEGESGLLSVHPRDFRPTYEPSKRRLTWPNGALATLYNATEPDQLRGPQHDAAACDELAKWQYADATWDNLMLGLRLGQTPRCLAATTPRPIGLLRRLLNDPQTVTTKGKTADNAVNLAAPFLKTVTDRYGGSRLGRQELDGELLEDVPGALWRRSTIDDTRRQKPDDLSRVVVAIDPAVSSNEGSDETGIVAGGYARGDDGIGHAYILDDVTLRGKPDEWARAAVALYDLLDADMIVAEANNGGEMVRQTIRTIRPTLNVKLVHASRGKVVRAEPVAALYERGVVHHCGNFAQLEDQMCAFRTDHDRKKDGSPDRVDALVWLLTELFESIISERKAPAAPKAAVPQRPGGWMGAAA